MVNKLSSSYATLNLMFLVMKYQYPMHSNPGLNHNFQVATARGSHTLFLSSVWSFDDEQYCRNYCFYPELTKTIISRLDFIEQQRGVLTDLSYTDFEVPSHFLVFFGGHLFLELFG